jgi:hypothetical protein
MLTKEPLELARSLHGQNDVLPPVDPVFDKVSFLEPIQDIGQFGSHLRERFLMLTYALVACRPLQRCSHSWPVSSSISKVDEQPPKYRRYPTYVSGSAGPCPHARASEA